MNKILITFKSSRSAIKADGICSKLNLGATVITLPEDISSECGMALEASSLKREEIIKALDEKEIEYKIYDRLIPKTLFGN